MVEAVMLWNEPNNLSHWNFEIDPGWSGYAAMVNLAADHPTRVPLNQAVRELMEANQPGIRQLATEGRELVQRVGEERRGR